jgi:hypothetical protein
MPVSLTDPNSDAAGDFRDDHWFVAGIQRTGKCRHSQERNEKKGKHSILHGILLEWDARRPDARQNTRSVFSNTVGIRYVDRVNVFLDRLRSTLIPDLWQRHSIMTRELLCRPRNAGRARYATHITPHAIGEQNIYHVVTLET